MIFQDLVRKMLVVDPKKRLSVYDALRHPWIVAETNSTRELPVVTEKLKEFNHKRRLKVHPFVFRLIFFAQNEMQSHMLYFMYHVGDGVKMECN